MDLSASDVALLNQARRRRRFSKLVLTLFLTLSLTFATVALWFGAKVTRATISVDPLQTHGLLSACAFSALQATLHAVMGLFAWGQSRSDALLLKLADQRSGYPDYTR